MTDTRKAMKMALEALEYMTKGTISGGNEKTKAAIDSLKAALAAQGEKREVVASSECPICGNDAPHRHATHEVEDWLTAQGNRFLPNGVIVKAKPAYEFVLIDKAAYDTPVCEYHGPDGDFRPFFKKLPGFNESCRNLYTHPDPRIKELEGEVERLKSKLSFWEDINNGRL